MAAPDHPMNIPKKRLQYDMIEMHGILKHGYEIVLKHLDNPPRDDMVNFLGYCESWAATLDHHHDTEEKCVFPFLSQKLDLAKEGEEHAVIHDIVDALLVDFRAAKADPSKFDPVALKNMMIKLKEPLFTHLDEEVEHLSPENVGVFSDEEMRECNRQLMKYSQSHGDPWMSLPFIFTHVSPELKKYWPETPWILRKFMVPYVFSARYSGYWKYSPYKAV